MNKHDLFKLVLIPSVIDRAIHLGFIAVMSIWVSPYWGWLVVPVLWGGPVTFTKWAAKELDVFQ